MAIKSLQHSSLTDNIFYRSLLAGNAAFEPSDEDILAEQVLSSSAASVTFSGLDAYAADYEHLQIRMVARATGTSRSRLQINGDTGNNYGTHLLFASPVQSAAAASTDKIALGLIEGTANHFSASVVDILDAFDTNKNTTVRALSGLSGSSSEIALSSGFLNNTATVSSLRIFTDSPSFVAGSTFTLIGVK